MHIQAAWISAIIATGCSLLSGVIGIPLLRRRIRRKMQVRDNASQIDGAATGKPTEDKKILEMMAVG